MLDLSDPAASSRTLDAGGIRTHLHDAGDGAPLLLLHGSGPGVSAWANWRLNLPAFAQTLRVVAPDLVGFGGTRRPPGHDFVLSGWVDHVVAVLDTLDLDRVAVVGNSFGGAVALHLAARYPERVDRLVLMGSVGVPFRLTPGLDAVWGYEPSVQAMRELLDVFAYDRSLVNDELAELRYRASIDDGVQESYAAMFPAPRQHWIDSLAVSDDVLHTLPMQTLVIHGREDQVIPLDNSLHLARAIPHAQLHVFGHCGHWVQIEHADRFVRLVRDFIAEGVAQARAPRR